MSAFVVWTSFSLLVALFLFSWAYFDLYFDVTFHLAKWRIGFFKVTDFVPSSDISKRYRFRVLSLLTLLLLSITLFCTGVALLLSASKLSVFHFCAGLVVATLQIASVFLLQHIHLFGYSWRLRRVVYRLMPIAHKLWFEWPESDTKMITAKDGLIRLLHFPTLPDHSKDIIILHADRHLSTPENMLSGMIIVRDQFEDKCALAFNIATFSWVIYSIDGYIPRKLSWMNSILVHDSITQICPNWFNAKYDF